MVPGVGRRQFEVYQSTSRYSDLQVLTIQTFSLRSKINAVSILIHLRIRREDPPSVGTLR